MSRSIATSVYRLADSQVLIGVADTAQGPQPLFMDVDGENAVVAFTDVDAAKADLPDTHRLFSIQVAELLSQLPPHAGMLVDPAADAVHVPAAAKQQVVDAARPFPEGAVAVLGHPAQEPEALLARLRQDAEALPWLRRVWRAWYQAADADPKLLLVVEAADAAADSDRAAEAVMGSVAAAGYSEALIVLALHDLPPEPRAFLLDTIPPLLDRA